MAGQVRLDRSKGSEKKRRKEGTKTRGKGCKEAFNTSPHGAGRIRSRGAAKRELDVESFKGQMAGKTWQDRDAKSLLDEAPDAYKPIEVVMDDSKDLVESVAVLSQFINYKGL